MYPAISSAKSAVASPFKALPCAEVPVCGSLKKFAIRHGFGGLILLFPEIYASFMRAITRLYIQFDKQQGYISEPQRKPKT